MGMITSQRERGVKVIENRQKNRTFIPSPQKKKKRMLKRRWTELDDKKL
jgi:hypothetical protein